jgi:hypothetical protein
MNGTISPGADANTKDILWNEGPVVGRANFTPSPGFTCEREVNVVQVKIQTGTTNRLTYNNFPIQSAPGSNLIISASPGPAMTARITIERIEGPTVSGSMRGVKFIQMGFIQNGMWASKHSDFDGFTPGRRRQSNRQDGVFHLDYVTNPPGNISPWYDSMSASAYFAPATDALLIGGIPGSSVPSFETSDNPQQFPTDTMSLTISPVTDDVDRFAIEMDFNIYFAVRTTDAANGSQNIYTQRGSASWVFNGDGTVSMGTWTRTGAGNTGSGSFTQVTDGSVVPITTGTPMNTLTATGQTWSTINQ